MVHQVFWAQQLRANNMSVLDKPTIKTGFNIAIGIAIFSVVVMVISKVVK